MTETTLSRTNLVADVYVDAVRRALHEAFEVDFTLWVRDAQWTSLSDDEQIGDATRSVVPGESLQQVLAEFSEGDPEPRTVQVSNDCHLLAVPISQYGEVRLVATATIDTNTPNVLVRFAKVFLRELEQRDQLEKLHQTNNAFLVQVTRDFENLGFLRSIAEELEISEERLDPFHLGQSVLPQLNHSVHAETLLLIGAETRWNASDASEVLVGKPVVRVGPEVLSADQSACLVQRYRDAATEQAVVKNSFAETPNGADFPEVRSFNLVQIAKSDYLIGWLLAVNRRVDAEVESGDAQGHLGEFQFGTFEASVMASAASILATHARNSQLFQEKEALLTNVIRSLVYAIEAKDEYTRGHSERVAMSVRRLGRELGLEEKICERLYLTGLLHDVGKIGVADSVLRKTGKLTVEEFEQIKQHPDKGWAILCDLEQLRYVLPGVLTHHERFDGKGYPDGLSGENIPLDGRVLAVCDAYDAMTSDRPYRTGISQEMSEEEFRNGSGSQWDPHVVQAFFRAMPDIIRLRETYRPKPQPRRKN